MAVRSLSTTLKRALTSRRIPPSDQRCPISRLFSSIPMTTTDDDDLQDSKPEDDLRSRIFRLRLPKRSAINALDKWVAEGNNVSISQLRNITKDLKKSHRFKHALEVQDDMYECRILHISGYIVQEFYRALELYRLNKVIKYSQFCLRKIAEIPLIGGTKPQPCPYGANDSVYDDVVGLPLFSKILRLRSFQIPHIHACGRTFHTSAPRLTVSLCLVDTCLRCCPLRKMYPKQCVQPYNDSFCPYVFPEDMISCFFSRFAKHTS